MVSVNLALSVRSYVKRVMYGLSRIAWDGTERARLCECECKCVGIDTAVGTRAGAEGYMERVFPFLTSCRFISSHQ